MEEPSGSLVPILVVGYYGPHGKGSRGLRKIKMSSQSKVVTGTILFTLLVDYIFILENNP